MTGSVAFEFAGPPIGKARPRITRWGAYTPQRTAKHEASIKAAAGQAMAGQKPLEGPLKGSLIFTMPIPASWPKRKRQDAEEGRIWPTGKPDADNLAKAVMDACNGVVYVDDSQIVALAVVKMYGTASGTSAEFGPV